MNKNIGKFTSPGAGGAKELANYVLERSKSMPATPERDCLVALANAVKRMADE